MRTQKRERIQKYSCIWRRKKERIKETNRLYLHFVFFFILPSFNFLFIAPGNIEQNVNMCIALTYEKTRQVLLLLNVQCAMHCMPYVRVYTVQRLLQPADPHAYAYIVCRRRVFASNARMSPFGKYIAVRALKENSGTLGYNIKRVCGCSSAFVQTYIVLCSLLMHFMQPRQ